ncbi:MAG: response regulator [Candidatus Solibacter sp.]
MAGECILIVDDTVVNLKLTRILLVNEGYQVVTAGSAEEALELLRGPLPRLILADIQLPGMDGLEMTRLIKADDRTRGIAVIAVTAFAMKSDEQRAIEAGCDGYVTKPIDTRTLGARIREWLARHPQPDSAVSEAGAPEMVPDDELQTLRRRFLQEGQDTARRILLDLDGMFDAAASARAVHQWVGTGGLLGYPELSRQAREVENLLRERPVDGAQVRELLTNLLLAFHSPREARETPMPEAILKPLSGRCVGMVGLPESEMQRLNIAVDRAHASAKVFESEAAASAVDLAGCDVIAAHLAAGATGAAWLGAGLTGTLPPTVFVGNREDVLALPAEVLSRSAGLLIDSWQPDEALLRLSQAVSRLTMQALSPAARPAERVRVVVADDEPRALEQLGAALGSYDIDVVLASSGTKTLQAVREARPHAAVVGAGIPDGSAYEVLAAMRADHPAVRTMMMIAPHQESEMHLAFQLGAADYVVKPFSPAELVARLKRLLAL